jgi:glycosyltransferase involved in cell wall biosynthesis
MNRKKIVRAVTASRSTGFYTPIVKDLQSRGYEVISLSSPGPELQEIQDMGVKVVTVPMERHISLLRDFKALLLIIRLFKKEKPYLVHSMTPKAGMLCMLAAWICRVPRRVHTFTGLIWPTSVGVKKKILMATDWLTCACATHIIPEGEGVKNDLQSHIIKKPMKVLGFGNIKGVDMEYFSISTIQGSRMMADLQEMKGESFTFLFVGRIVGDKGINELCLAFNRLHVQYPKTKLWLVGAFEEKLDPVKAETRTLIENKDNGIEAVGIKKGRDLLAYYATADCFIMPSYREGFPNTVLEAGAMGLPSIVTDINGSREIIKEGENGMIVPPRDEESLFIAMQVMLKSKADREKMAGNARKMIADRFEQGFVRKCLLDYYDEIL